LEEEEEDEEKREKLEGMLGFLKRKNIPEYFKRLVMEYYEQVRGLGLGFGGGGGGGGRKFPWVNFTRLVIEYL